MQRDAATSAVVVSDSPFADVIKNLTTAGRGERLVQDATTDVWTLDGFSYIGTFNSPCGTGAFDDAGVRIFDVHNRNNVTEAGSLPSVAGSRANDVKVANMNSGAVLVHSNESCAGGPGGFEVWDVDDPTAPSHLASVRIDELAEITPFLFAPGTLEDVGVHNLFLFSQGASDYVAAVAGTAFDNFMIFDITDPTSPVLASAWGAEEMFDPGVGDLTLADDPTGARTLDSLLWLFDGFGASQNRFLHDMTITADGSQAYLANWDAGLVLLDISDPTDPTVVSVAIDPSSEDGEVNSHAVWPTADGSIVVEGEEDFAPFETIFEITTGPAAGQYPAAEGAVTVPIVSLTGGTMAGPTVYVGFGCEGSVFDPGPPFDLPMPTAPGADQIALTQRSGCFFSEKIINAEAAGYAGVVVFNDAERGDALIAMSGDPTNLPGVFVGHSTGLAIAGVASAGDLVIGAPGAAISVTVLPDGWSGMRIWDYSDPTSPVLASTFNTVCSADPVDPSCDPRGTYSSHNVIVEEGKAYISWYTDGVLILDISDPYNPVEVGRYHREGSEFEAENGGIQDVWGIYKAPGEPWIYASDRNGGLYILKEYGSGSAGRGRP